MFQAVMLLLMLCLFLNFKGTGCQSVKVFLKSCELQYTIGQELKVEVFLNTSGTTEDEWPLDDIAFYKYGYDTCHLNLTQDGCDQHNTSVCGYCDREVDDGYFIIFTTTIEIYYEYYDYRCVWQGKNSLVDGYWYSYLNGYNRPLQWTFELQYTSTNHSSFSNLADVKHSISVYYYPYDYYYGFKVLSLGTPREQFIAEDFKYNPVKFDQSVTSITDDLILITDHPKCQHVCESIVNQIHLDNIEINVEEQGNGDLDITIYNVSNSGNCYIRDGLSLSCDFYSTPYEENTVYTQTLNPSYYIYSDLVFDNISISLKYNVSDCTKFNTWNLSDTNIVLSSDCPSGAHVKKGFIKRGTSATCKCQLSDQSVNFLYVQWFDSLGQTVSKSGKYSDLIISGIQEQNDFSYVCNLLGINDVNGIVFHPKFFDLPVVTNFTVNDTQSINVTVGDDVTMYCHVQSDPPAKAVILGSGLGRVTENVSDSNELEFSLHDLQCNDSGRYFCTGRNGFEENVTSFPDYVDINVICSVRPVTEATVIPTVQISPDKNTVFTFKVYGYPEPTEFGLKIETGRSASDIDANMYRVTYTRLTPPFGLITVTVYDANTRGTITYVLSVKSEAGEVSLKFQAIKETPHEKTESTPEAVIIGSVVGVGCILLITTLVVCLIVMMRKRRLLKNKSKQSDTYLQVTDGLDIQQQTHSTLKIRTQKNPGVYVKKNKERKEPVIEDTTNTKVMSHESMFQQFDHTIRLPRPNVYTYQMYEPEPDYPNDDSI